MKINLATSNTHRVTLLAVVLSVTLTTSALAAVTITSLGTPRILVSNAATLTNLRGLLSTNAPSATRFKTMVDNQLSGAANYYGFEPWYAALMKQVTGVPNYCTYAVTRTETFVVSEEALIAQHQRPAVAGDSYLEVGPMIGNLALVYDWCRASMTVAQRQRWMTYANQAVWNVWHPAGAKWGTTPYPWSGWSVDNPVNNYYYSFLEATMLLGLATHGENPQAPTWIAQFRTVKLEYQLFPTFTRDLTGGGSREGTGYGTAMKNLWRLYDWWERSTGDLVAARTPHTLASLPHLMHSIVPTLDQLTPTGDHARDSTAALFDYHREYLQELMRLFRGTGVDGVAKSLLAQSSVPTMQNSFMFYSDYLYDHAGSTARPLTALETAYWGSGTGQFSMRSAWDKTAVYANFICGPYTESHAHRDQGSFTLFKGSWLAYDANIDSHSGIQQGEALHNLVRIEDNGTIIQQRPGETGAGPCAMRALAHNSYYDYASANVTPVYGGQAQVGKVEREFVFIKPSTFIVFDRVQSVGATTRKVWTLNVPVQPVVNGQTFSVTRGVAPNANSLDVLRLAPTGLTTVVRAWPSLDSDLLAGYRVDVTDSAIGTSYFLHTLDVNKSVLSAVRADASGQTGATLSLRDGRKVTVRFNNATAGGTLEIRNAANAVVVSGALPTTVKTPSLFRTDVGPLLTIGNVTQTEGNAGTKNSVFTVTLSPAATSTVTVNCSTADGSAVVGSDYTALNTLLTFTPGQTNKTCTVPVISNTVVEPNETFFVNLRNAVGATIVDPDFRGIGVILNDDGPLLSITDVTATEGNVGNKNFVFTVTLNPAATSNVTVRCLTTNGTAAVGSDYTALNTLLTFTPGQTSKTCTVPVIGDTVVEPNETFYVNLTSPVGATIVDPDFRGLGTITKDD
ncbi:MAG: hypothetical protein HOP18_03960 [Deltaproteobacteria bacterium]|nr:hypothetical protein [Deltaproteobacteria bacterium]